MNTTDELRRIEEIERKVIFTLGGKLPETYLAAVRAHTLGAVRQWPKAYDHGLAAYVLKQIKTLIGVS